MPHRFRSGFAIERRGEFNARHHVADEETTLLPQAGRVLEGRLEELGWAMTRRRFQLARPRAGEMALTAARSHPDVVLAAAALLVGAIVTRRARMSNPTSLKWLPLARPLVHDCSPRVVSRG